MHSTYNAPKTKISLVSLLTQPHIAFLMDKKIEITVVKFRIWLSVLLYLQLRLSSMVLSRLNRLICKFLLGSLLRRELQLYIGVLTMYVFY